MNFSVTMTTLDPPVTVSDPEVVNVTLDTEVITNDDAAWALTCAFLILTMQTGFAMLECGSVSSKNVANIMVKNVVDVSLGGVGYWIFGYAISFGRPSNAFCGMGEFFFTLSEHSPSMGTRYAKYFFQFSFATTATTIVSGSVAERMKLHAYMLFSFFNTFVYVFPASWVWNAGEQDWNATAGFHGNTGGFLYKLGFYDFAGTCAVHLNGGMSALVAAMMLGPRAGRFQHPEQYKMSSPVTSLTGMFMLWWAWLGFNCGSTFGVSGNLWKITALVSVTTLNGAIGGGLVGLFVSMIMHRGKVTIDFVINSVLGGLVAITGIASVTSPGESIIIGSVGGLVAIMGITLLDYIRIDDPVGAAPVHLMAAVWGTLVVGLFAKDNNIQSLRGLNGVLHGGGFHLLGVQALGVVCIGTWSAVLTFLQFKIIDKFLGGIRMSPEEEVLGADWCEHGIHSEGVSQRVEKTMDEFGRELDKQEALSIKGESPARDPEEMKTVRALVNNINNELAVLPKHRAQGRHLMFSVDAMGTPTREKDRRAELVLKKISGTVVQPQNGSVKRRTLTTIDSESLGSESGEGRDPSKKGMYASFNGAVKSSIKSRLSLSGKRKVSIQPNIPNQNLSPSVLNVENIGMNNGAKRVVKFAMNGSVGQGHDSEHYSADESFDVQPTESVAELNKQLSSRTSD